MKNYHLHVIFVPKHLDNPLPQFKKKSDGIVVYGIDPLSIYPHLEYIPQHNFKIDAKIYYI